MKLFYFIIIFCTSGCMVNSDDSVVGHWRRADLAAHAPLSSINKPEFGDLLINPDSTFISVGAEDPPHKEGWSNTSEQNGRWTFSNDTLSLYIYGISRPVQFRVLKISDKRLIMVDEYSDSFKIELVRLKGFG